ncbi:MAG TPA: YeeE/YedE family protein [Aestuariivirgaceae bacterium]|nr:YeeE/YedE family protein [Aestuariivirgaceae bacterium]
MPTEFTPLAGLVGGLLIGLAAALLWLLNGRIAGVSGIVAGLLAPWGDDWSWRALFVGGLVSGAVIASIAGWFKPGDVVFPLEGPALGLAGLLVGIGTALAGGCTSGHGVCGVARLSPRSLAATAIFMATAIAVVFVVRHGV